MGRPSKYSTDQILDAASQLLIDEGTSSLSVSGVATRLGAPSGSIYHRFKTRDVLVASLWLRTIDRFHAALGPALDEPDSREAVVQLALGVLRWARKNTPDAQLLLLHRSSDLLHGDWPPELIDRNQAQRDRIEQMLDQLCERLGATTRNQRRRVAFAMIDIPYAAVRTPLSQGLAPPPDLDEIVTDAVHGVLSRTQPPLGDQR